MSTLSLRERRKRETSALIQRAALELARERGIDGVTIEAICEAAGISQRSFHNYFPFKDAVFVIAPDLLPDEAVERFLEARGDLMADLTDLMVAHAELIQQNRSIDKLLRDVAFSHPRLAPLQRAAFSAFENQLESVIATRLGLTAEHPSCSALAGAALGANRGTIDRWLEDADLNLPEAIRAGLDAMVALVRQTQNSSEGLATRPTG